MDKKSSMWRATLVWLILIVVLAFFLRPNRAVTALADNGCLIVTGASGYTVEIHYDKIESAELRESMDFGRLVDGTDENHEKSGTWENSEFGLYQLCVSSKIPSCIVMRTEEGIYAVNYESTKSTQSLYEALLQQIP